MYRLGVPFAVVPQNDPERLSGPALNAPRAKVGFVDSLWSYFRSARSPERAASSQAVDRYWDAMPTAYLESTLDEYPPILLP